jgi:hypothetical protein
MSSLQIYRTDVSRVFSQRQFRYFPHNFVHDVAHNKLSRLGVIFRVLRVLRAKVTVAFHFEFNCHAAIVKVHLLFRNFGDPSRSFFELCTSEIPARLSLFRPFPRITTGITLPRCLSANNIDPIARHFAVRHLLSLVHLLTSLPPFCPIYPIHAATNS